MLTLHSVSIYYRCSITWNRFASSHGFGNNISYQAIIHILYLDFQWLCILFYQCGSFFHRKHRIWRLPVPSGNCMIKSVLFCWWWHYHRARPNSCSCTLPGSFRGWDNLSFLLLSTSSSLLCEHVWGLGWWWWLLWWWLWSWCWCSSSAEGCCCILLWRPEPDPPLVNSTACGIISRIHSIFSLHAFGLPGKVKMMDFPLTPQTGRLKAAKGVCFNDVDINKCVIPDASLSSNDRTTLLFVGNTPR